ncbi:MAG: hypothetical protein D8M18_11230 [Bacteroidetes bacterium]|nr:hypothetical protein [Bacteroidota bacterium]
MNNIVNKKGRYIALFYFKNLSNQIKIEPSWNQFVLRDKNNISMKKLTFILSLVILTKIGLAQSGSVQISSSKLNNEIAPSDQEVIPFDEKAHMNETIAIFNDAIEFSRADNAYVKPYLNKANFPKKTGNSTAQIKKFNAELENWIKANPEIIQQLYKDRDALHKKLNIKQY